MDYQGKFERVKFYISKGLRQRECPAKVYIYHANRRLNFLTPPKFQELHREARSSVNQANRQLNMLTRTRYQELARECGTQLQEECDEIMKARRKQNKPVFAVTDYAMTQSYHLSPKTSHVIHAMGPDVGPVGEETTRDECEYKKRDLKRTILRAMRAVEEELPYNGKKHSVAFSPISTELFGDMSLVTYYMVEAVYEHLGLWTENSHIDKVYFLTDDADTRQLFATALEKYLEPPTIFERRCKVM